MFEAIKSEFESGDPRQPTLGVVPIENSTNGPVAATFDQLASAKASQSLRVVSEVRVPIRHCLLGRKQLEASSVRTSRNDPNSSAPANFHKGELPHLELIKELYTHPQAWGQCTKFMKALGLTPPVAKPLPMARSDTDADGVGEHLQLNITCHDATSTSSAAALAASDTSGSTAAISSYLAAQAHGAGILAEGLEDSTSNVTRFLVVQPRSQPLPGILPHLKDAMVRKKALVWFNLSPNKQGHGRPSALSEALNVFGKQNISFTSINARPRGGDRAFEYTFIVEMDLGEAVSHATSSYEDVVRHDGLDQALAELSSVVAESACAGIWLWKVND